MEYKTNDEIVVKLNESDKPKKLSLMRWRKKNEQNKPKYRYTKLSQISLALLYGSNYTWNDTKDEPVILSWDEHSGGEQYFKIDDRRKEFWQVNRKHR